LLTGNLYYSFANVMAMEDSRQCLRGLFQALHKVDSIGDPAFSIPLADGRKGLFRPPHVVETTETLQAGLFQGEKVE
jgi:hypothetical protein